MLLVFFVRLESSITRFTIELLVIRCLVARRLFTFVFASSVLILVGLEVVFAMIIVLPVLSISLQIS